MNSIIVILFMIFHIMCCTFFFTVWKKKERGKQENIYAVLMIFFIPIFGVMFLIIADKTKLEENENDINRSFFGDYRDFDKQLYLKPIDAKEEMNIVSMEEALSVNNYQIRRKMIMETLQDGDATIYINSLKKALENEDIETSHYATAVIMELQRKISDMLLTLERLYNESEKDYECAKKLEECLEKIIFSGIYDERNLIKYYERYRELSDEILEKMDIDEKFYFNRIKFDIKISDFTHAGELCKRYMKEYPESEDMVICNIKFCVLTANRKRLDDFLEKLKKLPVKLTQDSLKYIRFFKE